MDGSRVVRVEVDEDGDGQIDRWEHHKEAIGPAPTTPAPRSAPGAPDLTLDRVERATRHDGHISRREFFDGGQLVRVEEDTDANGSIDKWESYENGALSVMALDTRGTGKPDRRLVYQPGGSVTVEVDETGSGVFKPLTP